MTYQEHLQRLVPLLDYWQSLVDRFEEQALMVARWELGRRGETDQRLALIHGDRILADNWYYKRAAKLRDLYERRITMYATLVLMEKTQDG